jgi:hypothetical protein
MLLMCQAALGHDDARFATKPSIAVMIALALGR